MTEPQLPIALRLAALAHGLAVVWIYPLLTSNPEDRVLFIPAAALLALTPFIAIGLVKVKRAAWVMLYVELAVLVAVTLATIYFTKEAPHVLPATAHVAITALAFLPRNMRSPFTHNDGRGFRAHKRWDINLQSVVDVDGTRREAETMDLSQKGAYVGVHTRGLTLNQRVMLEVHLRNGKMLRLPAHVMSLNPEGIGAKAEGVGVQFSHLTPHDVEAIDGFIEEGRRHMRTPVRVRATFDTQGDSVRCETYDLSVSGCYLETDPTALTPGDQVALTLFLHEGDRLDVVGECSWLPDTERAGKPPGIALEFRSLSKRDETRLRDRLAEAGIVGDE